MLWVHKKYTYSPSYNTLTLHLSPCCGYTKNIYPPRRTLHLLYTHRHVWVHKIYIYSPSYITLTLHLCIAILWVHKKDTYSPSYNTLTLHLSPCCGYIKNIHTHPRTIHLLYTYRHGMSRQIYIYSPSYITLNLHLSPGCGVHKIYISSPSYITLTLHLSPCCGYMKNIHTHRRTLHLLYTHRHVVGTQNIYILPVVHYTYFALMYRHVVST